MHYLSAVYSITIPVHVSGLLVAHHQEVTYICNNWYVLYVLIYCWLAWLLPSRPADSKQDVQHVQIVTYIRCYLLSGELASPKHVQV
jgi:hypothetical protein